MTMTGFEPPSYPYDLLGDAQEAAKAHEGGMVDLSIGTPCDPPPQAALEALCSSGTERGYPSSVGSAALRQAAISWMQRRFGVDVDPAAVAACVGTKELVASLPAHLRLRYPERNVVLCPEPAYPTYAMGAVLAGCRAVPVGRLGDGRSDLESISEQDAAAALLLWVNSPSNPTGDLDDLEAAARWGSDHGVIVASDECYCEFTWNQPPATILSFGNHKLLAIHSLSKRSNLAGVRVGFYAGDPDLVHYLSEVRKHAGMMVPGPAQAAAAAALEDDEHVQAQRGRYSERLSYLSGMLTKAGWTAPFPEGGFYVWANKQSDDGPLSDGWAMALELARQGGVLVGPGELYNSRQPRVRLATVAPMERLLLVGERMGF